MSEEFRTIGKMVTDVTAFDKVTGEAKFNGDAQLPGMLHAKTLRSPYARADIIDIDTSQAEAHPGVALVMTCKNFPHLLPNYAQFVGQDVAVVVAEDRYIAEQALHLIKVEYKVLPFVIDPVAAMQPDAPQALPDKPNVLPWQHLYFSEKNENGHFTKRENGDFDGYGDPEQGRKEAEVIVEREGFKYARAHCPAMSTSSCVADYKGGKLTLYMPTQSPYAQRLTASKFLQLPANRINIKSLYTGGSFGSRLNSGLGSPKEDPSFVCLAGGASIALGRPVSICYSRDEEFLHYWARGSFNARSAVGFKKDGTLVMTDTEIWRDISTAGFGMGTLGFDATCTGTMLYSHNCRHSKHVKHNVCTNGPGFVGWQGYGNPEMFIAMETTMDVAAEELGMDPVELRRKNHMRQGDNFLSLHYDFLPEGAYLSHTGIDKCLDAGVEKVKWQERKPHTKKSGTLRHGLGMALAIQQSGGQNLGGQSIVKLQADGTATLICNYQDFGQAGRTTQSQIVAEVLNIPFENVNMVSGETDSAPSAHWQSCSSGTYVQSPATYQAAQEAKTKLLGFGAKVLQCDPDELDTRDGMIFHKAAPEKPIPWFAAFNAMGVYAFTWDIVGYGYNQSQAGPTPAEQGATFVSLDVDTETGQLKNIKVTHCQDCGRALQPRVVEAHFLGIHHGLEALVGAEQILDPKTGKLLNDSWIDYPVASILDFEVEPVIIEEPDPTHPYGATGIGQSHQNGLAAAVSNAIYNAVGVRLKETPFTPARILAALGKI